MTYLPSGLCCENNKEPHLLHANKERKTLQGIEQTKTFKYLQLHGHLLMFSGV